MNQISHLRLLPWTSPDGKPAHLVTNGTASRLALLADHMEATQLDTGAEVLRLSRATLRAVEPPTVDELYYVTQRLAECLTDALRVAESRGHRIPAYES